MNRLYRIILLFCSQLRRKGFLCDCSSSRRNESAVIMAACKCIQASRRQIDFSISDWPFVIAQPCERLAEGGTLSLIDAVMVGNRLSFFTQNIISPSSRYCYIALLSCNKKYRHNIHYSVWRHSWWLFFYKISHILLRRRVA